VPPAKFFDAHRAFYASYDKWIPTMAKAGKAQTDRWYQKDTAAARRAIATDFGFYQLMAAQGLTQAAATKCLNNPALAKKITDQRAAIDKQFPGFPGTPSFLLNGVLLAATAQWEMLQPQIDARL
jgi:hypothetical protein